MTPNSPQPSLRLQLENVTKIFETKQGTHTAVEEVNMTVAPGEVVSIVGPTGCGKTTLLNMMAGFDYPSSGSISTDVGPVAGPGPDRAMLFQRPNLFPWLTVRDNLLFAARYGDIPKKPWSDRAELSARADHFINELGLVPAARRFPYQISGGMQARVALGRVLVADPPVLLMDEPFAALDALTRAAVHKLVLRMLRSADDKALVLITHDAEEAAILSDRVYVMSTSPGKVVAEIKMPFGHNRDYDTVVRDESLLAVKNTIVDCLEPFIRSSAEDELSDTKPAIHS